MSVDRAVRIDELGLLVAWFLGECAAGPLYDHISCVVTAANTL